MAEARFSVKSGRTAQDCAFGNSRVNGFRAAPVVIHSPVDDVRLEPPEKAPGGGGLGPARGETVSPNLGGSYLLAPTAAPASHMVTWPHAHPLTKPPVPGSATPCQPTRSRRTAWPAPPAPQCQTVPGRATPLHPPESHGHMATWPHAHLLSRPCVSGSATECHPLPTQRRFRTCGPPSPAPGLRAAWGRCGYLGLSPR
jgi:hypothetical protein